MRWVSRRASLRARAGLPPPFGRRQPRRIDVASACDVNEMGESALLANSRLKDKNCVGEKFSREELRRGNCIAQSHVASGFGGFVNGGRVGMCCCVECHCGDSGWSGGRGAGGWLARGIGRRWSII